MRLELLNQYRASASDGDWWCILDADEIYIDDPRSSFLLYQMNFKRSRRKNLHIFLLIGT
jgi:hypothetical protein